MGGERLRKEDPVRRQKSNFCIYSSNPCGSPMHLGQGRMHCVLSRQVASKPHSSLSNSRCTHLQWNRNGGRELSATTAGLPPMPRRGAC